MAAERKEEISAEDRTAHVIWCHPREDSLTARVVDHVSDLLNQRGLNLDVLELYGAEFDPSLRVDDEPDWENPKKLYSEVVEQQVLRAQNADYIIVVFPVWWFGLPALLKGYFDRVWNFGRMYGNDQPANVKGMLWLGLAGLPEESFTKRGYDTSLALLLNEGIAGYCGISHSETVLLYDTLGEVQISRFQDQVGAAISGLVTRK